MDIEFLCQKNNTKTLLITLYYSNPAINLVMGDLKQL